MKIFKNFGLLMSIVFIPQLVFAGGEDRSGTSAASHLLVPVSARYLSGGGAVANAQGLEAIYWNPAGLDRNESRGQAIFGYRSYIADININYLGISGRFGRAGTFGFMLRTFAIGDLEETTIFEPDGTGATFEPTYFVLGVTYSRTITDRVGVGFTFNWINESIPRVGASGFAFDAGVQYTNVVNISNLDFGVAVKNIGPPLRWGGPALWNRLFTSSPETPSRGLTSYKVEAAAFELPSVIEMGLTYHYDIDESQSLNIGGTFQNNNFSYDEYRALVEYNYDNTFMVRGAYQISPEEDIDAISTDPTNTTALTSISMPNIFGSVSFGATLMLKKLVNINASLDYGFIATEFFDDNHIFSLSIAF